MSFSNDHALSVLVLPKSITTFTNINSRSPIHNCNGLTELKIHENSIFYSKNNCIIRKSDNALIIGCKTSIIPYGVQSIGSCAFAYLTQGNTHLVLPVTVNVVYNTAVYPSSIFTQITIQNKNLTFNVSSGAFGTQNVTVINYNGTKQEWRDANITRAKLFGTNNSKEVTIHCKDGDWVMASGAQTPSYS